MLDALSHPTRIACLTPAGAGAIATLALRGPRAWLITRSLFRARLPEQPAPGTFYLGRFGDDANASDEVVLAVKPEGLELHCHGGAEVVRFIQDLCVTRGAVPCSWKELQPLGNVSRLERLAHEQLMQAATVKTAAILLDQVHGAFDKTLGDILGCVHDDHVAAARLLGRLVQTQHLGRHLVQPFRVVIAGAPNAGKSSLVNALAGFTRSVVSSIPGTTRDVVATRIALDGWPVELIDTAGFQDSADDLERAGMARAREALGQADLRLWVIDSSVRPLPPPPGAAFDGAIMAKVDMPAAWDYAAVQLELPACACPVSAKTGQGVPELGQSIASLLGLELTLAQGEGVAFTPELCSRILLAYEAIPKGWDSVNMIVEDICGSNE